MSYPRGVELERADLSIHLTEIHGPSCSLWSKLRNGKISSNTSWRCLRPEVQASATNHPTSNSLWGFRSNAYRPPRSTAIASTASSSTKAAQRSLVFGLSMYGCCAQGASDGLLRYIHTKKASTKQALLTRSLLFVSTEMHNHVRPI